MTPRRLSWNHERQARSAARERRVINLRRLAEQYDYKADLAVKLGCSRAYISQLIGPNPTRPITEWKARYIEQQLALPAMTLDKEPT